MKTRFIFPLWGTKGYKVSELVESVKASGYGGMEINVAHAGISATRELSDALKEQDLTFVAQQWLPPLIETPEQYLTRFEENLYSIVAFNPLFINSHTGKDYFSFADNCKAIDKAGSFTVDTGIPVYHETHRGRFPFHANSTATYLKAYPGLPFTADLSHWCNVAESLLQDQPGLIDRFIPNIKYIHARVGYEHSPQVSDPRAPEWEGHLGQFLTWWDAIADYQYNNGANELFICPEFGPVPYMPALPYSRVPVADQREVNDWMLNLLRGRYGKYDETAR
jgi:sugar phosphate isomerase/epimerase